MANEDVLKITKGVVTECDRSAKNVVIPEGVTEIGYYAFDNCESLTSVVIPAGVTKIGVWAFRDCYSLSSVEFGGTMAQWKAIERGYNWNYNVPAETVKCTDGEVKI